MKNDERIIKVKLTHWSWLIEYFSMVKCGAHMELLHGQIDVSGATRL
jgi:hypothetical protein